MSDDRELQGNLPAEDLPGDNSPVEELREEVEKAQRQPDKYGIFAAKSGNSWIEDCINMAAPIIFFFGLIVQYEITALFGPTGSGKTIFAMMIAEEIARFFKVMYIDLELSAKQFQMRFSDPETGLIYVFPENFIRAEIDPDLITREDLEIEILDSIEAAAQKGILFFILDNITFACNDSEKGATAGQFMIRLIRLKKKYNLTIICVAHTPKIRGYEPLTASHMAGSAKLMNFFDEGIAIGKSARDANLRYVKQVKTRSIPMTYDEENVQKTVRTNPLSAFLLFLTKLFDTDTILRVIADYLIGVTRSSDVIFFQIDIKGRCRTGKVMKYNPDTGKRIKDESQPGRITWVHTLLKKQLPEKWELKQCLFGEHLLAKYPDKPVVLVESEKTAIIGAAVMPECNWLATGGKEQLNDRVDVLEGHKVIAFPDSDAYDTWVEKVSERPWPSIQVSDYILRKATPEQKAAGADVADIFIAWKLGRLTTPASTPPVNPILEEIRRYISPEHLDNVMALIEELDLEIVSVDRILPSADETQT